MSKTEILWETFVKKNNKFEQYHDNNATEVSGLKLERLKVTP